MKKIGWVIVSCAVFIILPCITIAADSDVIKLGLVTPLSAPGDYEAGKNHVNTAEMAVEELNQKGGVLGKKIVLVKADDEGKPPVGVTATQRVITEEKVSAIVGGFHGAVALAQSKVADKLRVPILFHYSWPDEITKAHSDYVFRIGPYNSLVVKLLIPFLVKKGYKNIAVIFETTDTGINFTNLVEKLAGEKGIKVVTVGYPAEEQDLKPQLLALKAIKPRPELLLVKSVYQARYLIPKQAYEVGLAPETTVMATFDYPEWSPEWWKVMGDKGVGTMYLSFYSSKLKLTKVGEHFEKMYQEKYKSIPPIYAYFLYDAIKLVVDAMERAKSSDPKKVAEALKTARVEGTTGLITFDRKEGIEWNQWTGLQLFVIQFTAPKQKGADAAIVYP